MSSDAKPKEPQAPAKAEPYKAPENLKWDGEQYLHFMAKRHDKRFGDISIYKNDRSKTKVMMKEKSSGDQKTFTRDTIMARTRMELQHDNLHKMLGWSTQKKSELCSTHYYVRMFFDYPESDLRNEVAERKRKGGAVSDAELSLATSNALHGLDYLHGMRLAHGDIRPQLISSERLGGDAVVTNRILDRLADPSQIERAQVNNLMNNRELFMSPQLYKRINTKGKKKPGFDRQKNDLFALGMSMISAGTASSVKDCYKRGGKFDAQKLRYHLDRFRSRHQQNYSLCNVVTSLVEIEEERRPDTNMLLGRKQMVNENAPAPIQEQLVITEGPAPDNVEVEVEVEGGNFLRPETEVNAEAPPRRRSQILEGDDFFNNPNPNYVEVKQEPVEIVEEVILQPETTTTTVVRTQPIEVKESAPKDSEVDETKTTGRIIYGEPIVVRTYVDHSSKRYQRGSESHQIIAEAPEPGTEQARENNELIRKSIGRGVRAARDSQEQEELQEEYKQAVNMVPVEVSSQPVRTYGEPEETRVVKKTVIVKDQNGNIIDQYEENVEA